MIAAQVYLRICELGSLSAAARALGMSRPMVSRYLEQMELGRRPADPSLNPAADADPGREKVLLKTRGLRGSPMKSPASVSGPSQRHTARRLRALYRHAANLPAATGLSRPLSTAAHGLDINNHPVSLIGERIDVAIRITDNPEAGAIARRLGVCRSLLCAAPRWMRQHGPLTTPDDLQRHNCLLYSHFASQHWQFSDAQGREASVAVNGNLSAGISSLLLEAAVARCGIAMLPELEARGAIDSGTLEVVPGWTPRR